MRLMLWSPPELPGFGGGGGGGTGAGSLGTGVVLRLPAQGLMESTAEAQVDFSPLLSAGADPEAMLLEPVCHAREAPKEDQLLVTTRQACLLADLLQGSPRLACDGAEAGVERTAVCSKLSRAFWIGDQLRRDCFCMMVDSRSV